MTIRDLTGLTNPELAELVMCDCTGHAVDCEVQHEVGRRLREEGLTTLTGAREAVRRLREDARAAMRTIESAIAGAAGLLAEEACEVGMRTIERERDSTQAHSADLTTLTSEQLANILCDIASGGAASVWEASRLREAARRLRDDGPKALDIAWRNQLSQELDGVREERDELFSTCASLRDELDKMREDLRFAAGDLLMALPEPGTDAARLVQANRLMRARAEERQAALRSARVDLDRERAERDSLREQHQEQVNNMRTLNDDLRARSRIVATERDDLQRELMLARADAQASAQVQLAAELAAPRVVLDAAERLLRAREIYDLVFFDDSVRAGSHLEGPITRRPSLADAYEQFVRKGKVHDE